VLLQFLEMGIEITKLIWQNVSVWDKVKVLLSILFLHTNHVEAKSIFSSDFIALWEMIDFLVLIEPLV
jgi:hypothetical protein